MKFKKPVKSGLSIIIVGCGKVGNALVRQLSKEGHDITIIDRSREKVMEIANQYDIMGLAGNGASYSVQMEAGIEAADMLIAVTDSDELNLLCCTVAKHVSQCDTVARVRTPDYSTEASYLREKLGLTMIINPELEAAIEATRILCLPTALEVNSFAHGQAELIKLKITEGSMLDGISIQEFGKRGIANVLICMIERAGEVYIPWGDFVMQKGDILSFVAHRKTVKSFMQKFGLKTKQVKNTMIVGGGKAAYYLANQLLGMGISVQIIEQNKARCEELSILLPKAVIINADGSDEEVLFEEGIENVESFIPLTGIDEENIMLTLHAKQVSNAKVITKINRITFKNVINSLDLGSVIYPKYITSEAIIAYVRAKNDSMESTDSNSAGSSASDSNIETLYHMFDHRVEAIEFRVTKSSAVTGKPLAELKLNDEILISFINRNGTIIIPSGQDCILEGDTVMIVTTHTGFTDIQDILR